MMPFKRTALFLLIAILVPDAYAQKQKSDGKAEGKPVYCWISGGQRVCGNAPPPDTVMTEVERVSTRTGLVVNRPKTATPKTPEQGGAETAPIIGAHQQSAPTASLINPNIEKDQLELRIKTLKIHKTQLPNLVNQLIYKLVFLSDREMSGEKIGDNEKNELLKIKMLIIEGKKTIAMEEEEIKSLRASIMKNTNTPANATKNTATSPEAAAQQQ